MTLQTGWSWCHKCQQTHFTGNNEFGNCPSGGQHSKLGSGRYSMYLDDAPFPDKQSSWKWCNKCQSLFFSNQENLNGVCPSGGQHDGSLSGKYFVRMDAPQDINYQENWSWCNKCQVLYFSAGGGPTPCSAGGVHNNVGSGKYSLYHNQ